MKKKNLICAVVSNALIVCIIAILFFTCYPVTSTTTASAPIYSGNRSTNTVAFMFNVYENADNVRKILDILEKENVSATFFVGGVWADKNNDVLKEIAEKAELGNHGYLHKDHATLSKTRNEEEIMLCHNLVEKITGVKMTLFAPPSGSYGKTCISVCEENSYRVIMWSKDTIDWRDKDIDTITKRATTDTQSGDLILMHPTDHTVQALPEIIRIIKEKNLSIGTVSACISETI